MFDSRSSFNSVFFFLRSTYNDVLDKMKDALVVEPTGLIDGLDVGGEREKSKMTPEFLVHVPGRMVVSLIAMAETSVGIGPREETKSSVLAMLCFTYSVRSKMLDS